MNYLNQRPNLGVTEWHRTWCHGMSQNLAKQYNILIYTHILIYYII
jgi:hypothetical protein